MIQKKYLFTAHVLVYSIIVQYAAANALSKICQNMGVFWPYFPVKGQNRRLYGKMRVGQNRNSGVFYAMIFYQTILNTLRKKQKFHLISWCGIFVKRHNFRRVSGESPKTMRKLCLSAKFHTKKLGEITVFYAVILNKCWVYNIKIEYWIDTWLEYLSTLK